MFNILKIYPEKLKKVIPIILLFCTICYSQDWFPLVTGTTHTLQSIHFPSASYGWAVGDSSIIIATTNSGLSWTTQDSGSQTIFSAVQFINNTTGWIAGEFGTILKTTNGGINWINQPTPTTEILYGLSFINNQTGWTAGYGGVILKTTDAGQNWISENSGTNYYLRAIFFIDVNNGIATGYNGEIVRTSDGGNDWIQIAFNNTATLYCVYFIDSIHGWAGGLGSQRTINGGYNWSVMPGGYGTFGIFFTNVNTGWEVGFNQIYYTTSSGDIWTQINLGFSGWFFSVYFTSDLTGYICGEYGTIYKTIDGGGLIPTGINPNKSDLPNTFSLSQNYPNPFNPSTKIKFSLPLPSKGGAQVVSLKIYDLLGKEVASLIPPLWGGQEGLKPGNYEVEWNASNYPSGVYFYKLSAKGGAGDFTQTKKMLLIK